MTRATLAITALLVSSAAVAGPRTGQDNPTVTSSNASSCLGAERAGRNSNGGDRAQGGFGAAQSEYVQMVNSGDTEYANYGEALQAFMMSCENAPGGMGTDGE